MKHNYKGQNNMLVPSKMGEIETSGSLLGTRLWLLILYGKQSNSVVNPPQR